MVIPKHSLEIVKHNFVYNGSNFWNGLIGNLLNKCTPNEHNIMIPGSSNLSDLSASISIIKKRLKHHLFTTQQIQTPGRPNEWMPNNNWVSELK